jgi:hypothetical protein
VYNPVDYISHIKQKSKILYNTIMVGRASLIVQLYKHPVRSRAVTYSACDNQKMFGVFHNIR